MAERCSHRDQAYLPPVTAKKYVCSQCGYLFSLGPANDSPAVQVEIKLAACIADTCQLWEPGADRTEVIERYVEGFASQEIHSHNGATP
jgi:hypothetical protein